jgi:protein-L-isoaspartate(D-aspartate) O-methyltransferase
MRSKSLMISAGLAATVLLALAGALALDLLPAPWAAPASVPPAASVSAALPASAAPAASAASADATTSAASAIRVEAAPVPTSVPASVPTPVEAPAQTAAQPVAQPIAQAIAPAQTPAHLTGKALAVGEAQAAPVPGGGEAAAWSPGAPWNYKTFREAMRQSGRASELPEQEFAELQARKVVAMQSIERYLKRRFGQADANVLRAFRELPREYYHYDYQRKQAFASNSYEAAPKPWAIGYGSALSDYLGQAYMTQLSRPRPGDTVLEIGTGSGFQSSLLSRIVKDVYSVEIIQPLGTGVARIYKPLGLENVRTRVADGYYGWPEVKGGFDIIMVTCVARYVSPELLRQLKPEGRLIVPIGQPFKRGQVLYVFTKDKSGKVHSRKDMGVFFIPMTGKILQGKS